MSESLTPKRKVFDTDSNSNGISGSEEEEIVNTRKKPKTALGVNDFVTLLQESTVFIDKTLLIKEFLESPAKVLQITCPNKWGKSVNLSMIKEFLEIDVNELGEKRSDRNAPSYKIFEQNKVISRYRTTNINPPLKISKHIDDSRIFRFRGSYPVILVDFKSVLGCTLVDIEYAVKISIQEAFRRHKYLIKSRYLTEDQKRLLQCYTNHINGSDLEYEDVTNGLKFLSELLFSHFRKNVFILMDDYDTGVMQALQSYCISELDFRRIFTLFESIMINTFKGNKYLEKGLITGVFEIRYSRLNVVTSNILKNNYAKYYGFTENDVTHLIKKYKFERNVKRKVIDNYGGYNVLDSDLQLYNMWSVLNFLHTKNVTSYCDECDVVDVLNKFFQDRAIEDLCNALILLESCESYDASLFSLSFGKDAFILLKKTLVQDQKINEEITELFVMFLVAAGLLTASCEPGDVELPNYAMKRILQRKLSYNK